MAGCNVYGELNDSTASFDNVEIGSIDDIKLTMDGKDIDITTFGDTYESTLFGLAKVECTLSVVGYPASILAYGDTGDLSVSFGGGTSAITIADCGIKKVEIGQKAGDKITVNYTIGKTKVC